MSPQCVCEVSAQNTQLIIFYIMFKLSLFGAQKKSTISMCIPLNANELLLPAQGGGASQALGARTISSDIPFKHLADTFIHSNLNCISRYTHVLYG